MDLIAALLDLCKTTPQPIIAIDGPAGAGKTTLAALIQRALAKEFTIHLVHMDDLYAGWDCALDANFTETLMKIVSSHKSAEGISFAKFNWKENIFEEKVQHESKKLLILEGVGSGQRAIREDLTSLIWIDITPLDGLTRVIARDGSEIEIHMQKWLTSQSEHFRENSTQEESDFILTT
jgi:uridine kinase